LKQTQQLSRRLECNRQGLGTLAPQTDVTSSTATGEKYLCPQTQESPHQAF